MTPDPLGGDVTNPQSLSEEVGIFDRRYADALNNPATLTDPLGLNGQNPVCFEASRGAVMRAGCGQGYCETMGCGGGGASGADLPPKVCGFSGIAWESDIR